MSSKGTSASRAWRTVSSAGGDLYRRLDSRAESIDGRSRLSDSPRRRNSGYPNRVVRVRYNFHDSHAFSDGARNRLPPPGGWASLQGGAREAGPPPPPPT